MSKPRQFVERLLDRFPEIESWLDQDGLYYGASALVFTLAGLICGYFIWRKGYMQTLDAEAEVTRTVEELSRLQKDLCAESEGLGSGEAN